MQKHIIEPGLLQVFRFFAWLRLTAYLITALPFFFIVIIPDLKTNYVVSSAFSGINIFLLLGYLYIPQLKRLLGWAYIPLGIGYATLCLLIEQNILITYRGYGGYGPTQPFGYILLILVAWQYSFHTVIFYTLGTILTEIGISFFFPVTVFALHGFPNTEVMVVYGSMMAKTSSFIIIGYAVHRLVEAQRQQRRALAEANQKLVSHAATLEQLTISRERNRLSRELHDTLAHTLSALAVQLDAVLSTWQEIPEKGKSTLEQMLSTTRNGLNETRRALRALRASPLEELGLANAIRSLAEDVAARGNLVLELDVPENVDDLAPDVEQGFYRIAQESLENVIQHAQATRLSVNLTQKENQLTLIISDDGKGIDKKRSSDEHRLGIKGMKERADIMGAKLRIESQPKGGTQIILIMEQKL